MVIVRGLFLEMIQAKDHHEISWKKPIATFAKQLKALKTSVSTLIGVALKSSAGR